MKKLGLIIAALALVLGLTQCRKPDTSMWISKQTITFSNSGNDGQKGFFQDAGSVLNYQWQTGDVIHVYATTNEYKGDGTTDFGTNSKYCGKLDKVTITSETTATFTGEINVPNKAKALRFVHYGKGVTVEKGVATVKFASQTGVIANVSDKVIAKCDRPYTGNVYENCKLAVAFAILKFSFEKFDSDEKVTLTTPGNTQINVAAGGAISYNAPGKIDFNITSSAGKGNNKNEYFAVLMPKEETIYTFSDGLKRASGSIEIKENGYYTGNSSGAPVIVNTEPYCINPSDMKYTSILTNNITLGDCSSDGFTFSCTSQGGFERIFVPIHNLEPEQWYTITFSEEVTRSISSGAWWCAQGTYSANVTEVKNEEDHDPRSNIPNSIRQSPEKFACVMCLGGINDNFPYTQTPKVSTTFKATAETMYWTVEFSQFADGVKYTFNINLVDYGIKKIVPEPEHPYYADMPTSTMYGYNFVEQADKGLCSFKVYADYHTIDFYSYGADAHEKFNVPLRGLTKDKKYKLTFDYTRTLLTTGSSEFIEGSEFDNCFGISEVENTNYGSSSLHNTSGYGGNFTANHLSKETIEFTATAETMYWVWSQSKLNDCVRFHQVAENITLEQIK